jgi:hypothetical protein
VKHHLVTLIPVHSFSLCTSNPITDKITFRNVVLPYIASGGCFVEGDYLRNAFRWKASVGPWEERPGHFGDVWKYWTDDGLGYYEFLQVSASFQILISRILMFAFS